MATHKYERDEHTWIRFGSGFGDRNGELWQNVRSPEWLYIRATTEVSMDREDAGRLAAVLKYFADTGKLPAKVDETNPYEYKPPKATPKRRRSKRKS